MKGPIEELLVGLVQQDIVPDNNGVYFSGWVRIYADLLEECCDRGIMEPVGTRCDRDFSARFKS